MRLFILPGVGHCSGGDGPAQVDVLTPLMAWTELNRAPRMLIAGKTANQNETMGPGIPGPGGPGGPGGPNGPGGPGGSGRGKTPYSSPAQPTVFTRPVYPFPYIARFTGKGDPKDAANYEPVKSPVPSPQVFNTEAMKLVGPNNQKFYHVENGQLVADEAK
jgi:feruloyl esterase